MSDSGQYGADAPQGPGWWQASDGRWYPPETAAAPAAPAPAPAPAYAASPAAGAEPVQLDFDAPLEMARWRPFFSWLVAIPHFILLFVYGIVAFVFAVVAFFSVLFTGSIPSGVHTFIVKVLRYGFRVSAYVYWMSPDYPSFGLAGGDDDPGDAPIRVSISRADELKRLGPLYKWILAIPHFVVLYFVGIGMSIVLLISAFMVLFTGRWSEGMRNFVVGVQRWQTRVNAYLLLRDEYPPFSLS
jgi:hypothetical protein